MVINRRHTESFRAACPRRLSKALSSVTSCSITRSNGSTATLRRGIYGGFLERDIEANYLAHGSLLPLMVGCEPSGESGRRPITPSRAALFGDFHGGSRTNWHRRRRKTSARGSRRMGGTGRGADHRCATRWRRQCLHPDRRRTRGPDPGPVRAGWDPAWVAHVLG